MTTAQTYLSLFELPSKDIRMSSVELVHRINAHRERENPGCRALTHDNFIKKIRRVLKDTHVNFNASYIDSSGKRNKCYQLPEHECQRMLLSESYSLQNEVLLLLKAQSERITKLEKALEKATLEVSTQPKSKVYTGRDDGTERKLMVVDKLKGQGFTRQEVARAANLPVTKIQPNIKPTNKGN